MSVEARKTPRQRRAKATVDAILDATSQVLLTRGYEGLTTTAVAERAGVSIGSLYQYFPRKEALIAALYDRATGEFVTEFADALRALEDAPLERVVDKIIAVAITERRLPSELHAILFGLAPRIGRAEQAMAASLAATRAIQTALERRADELAPDLDPSSAAIVVETALEGLAHRMVQAHPAHLPEPRLAQEIKRLILAYLRAPALS